MTSSRLAHRARTGRLTVAAAMAVAALAAWPVTASAAPAPAPAAQVQAAPAAQEQAALAEDMPTYRCEMLPTGELPYVKAYGNCAALNGAPEQGPILGVFRIENWRALAVQCEVFRPWSGQADLPNGVEGRHCHEV